MKKMKFDTIYDEDSFFDELDRYEDSYDKKKPLKMKKNFKEKVKEKGNNSKKELYEFIRLNEKIDMK